MTDDSTGSGVMPTVLDDQSLSRGTAPAPRTILDGQPAAPGGAPVTSLDGGSGGGAPVTMLDLDAPAGPPGDWHAVNLPPPLHERFRIVETLPSGAEADVVLAASRATGERVAIKVFRTRDFSSPDMQAILQKLDAVGREHIIGVLERGQFGGRWWEVMPYAEHGSLDDLRGGALEPMAPERVRQVLAQVTRALTAVHDAQLIHRDVKPQNILVLDAEPLRVVLGDFGLARIVAATREQGSTSRTPAYAAPESLHGQLHATRDWWSLGVTCLELLWGRNPFQELDGVWMDEHVILETILSGRGIPRGPVVDPRWTLLLDGLLTQDHRQRWGSAEVLRWLDGESPQVHAPRQTAAPAGPPFVFNGVAHTDSLELARAFEADAAGAARITKGFAVNAPQSAALLGWLRARDHDVRELEGTRSPERAHVLLMTMLDPQVPPAVLGVSVAREDLAALVATAARSGWSGPEAGVLETLRRSGALGVLGRLEGHSELAVVDEQWQRTTDQLDALVQRLPEHVRRQVGPGTKPLLAAQAWLLVTATTGDLPDPRPSSETAAARRQSWFAELTQGSPGHADGAARRALVEVTMDLAADLTREQDAREEREAQERQRQQDERDRNYRASVRASNTDGVLAWAALVLAFVLPPVGAALGVLSLRQAFRHHLRRRKKAYLAVLVGGMTTVVYVLNALGPSSGLAA
jgi:tRNA A-37 threonylcarbamoyl transferase component Bud32